MKRSSRVMDPRNSTIFGHDDLVLGLFKLNWNHTRWSLNRTAPLYNTSTHQVIIRTNHLKVGGGKTEHFLPIFSPLQFPASLASKHSQLTMKHFSFETGHCSSKDRLSPARSSACSMLPTYAKLKSLQVWRWKLTCTALAWVWDPLLQLQVQAILHSDNADIHYPGTNTSQTIQLSRTFQSPSNVE